ncbi:MAG: AI-2E family transporter [Candidatus Poribacteria bacterium]|nr:AI-2E family transporter [Candidatus Poribacteria bacterium]
MTNSSPGDQSHSNEGTANGSVYAIITVVLAAGWVAFAYFIGPEGKGSGGERILLLHPMVPILLIFLLSSIYRQVEVKSVVKVLLAMVSIWLFINLSNILLPFILGFGFAYFFRFLLNTIQDIPLTRGRRLHLSRRTARVVLTALTLGVFAMLLLYIIPQVSRQSRDMVSGLVRFYNHMLPFAIGNEYHAVAVHRQPDGSNIVYLGTTHGIYRFADGKNRPEDITGGVLIGQSIQAVAVGTGDHQIHVGTAQGLYVPKTTDNMETDITTWVQIGTDAFAGKSIQAIAIPSWNLAQLYVGTDTGLYSSTDRGATWEEVRVDEYTGVSQGEISILSVACSAKGTKSVFVASNLGVYKSVDEGKTWTPITPAGLGDAEIHALAVAHERLFAGTSNGIYEWLFDLNAHLDETMSQIRLRILQNHAQWQPIEASLEPTPSSVPLLASLPQHGTIYAGNRRGIYRRTNPADWRFTGVSAKRGVLADLKDSQLLKSVGGTNFANLLQGELTERFSGLARTVGESIVKFVTKFSTIAFGFGGFLATVFLALIVFIYAGQSFNRYTQDLVNLFPDRHRTIVRLYLTEINRTMESFLRGQVAVSFIIGIISVVVYSIIGVPFALVIGLLAGLCNAIPTFGPFIGGGVAILSLLMGFAAGDFDSIGLLFRIAILLGAIFGIQAIDNSLISPKVMSRAINVDPMVIMFTVIFGATVFGFWGVLLAFPAIVVIKSILTVSRRLNLNTQAEARE